MNNFDAKHHEHNVSVLRALSESLPPGTPFTGAYLRAIANDYQWLVDEARADEILTEDAGYIRTAGGNRVPDNGD